MAPDRQISFSRGAPSLDIIDVDGLADAARKAFADDPAGSCGYGDAAGYPPLREWIAERHGVTPDQVLVSNGSMQVDALLFQTLVAPGDPVVVEAPTYDRTLSNLLHRGARVSPVVTDADGMDVDALAALVERGLRPSLIHVIPNFQNPTGCTLSAGKRARLLALAAAHGLTVFEDDPYLAIRFEGDPLPTMVSQDTTGSVVYASSFSKTVCPGVRCGYVIGPAGLVARLARLALVTYISPNMVAQSIVNQFCRSGRFDPTVHTVRVALRERRDTLVAALRRELPELRFTPPQGGYFLWARLPDGVTVDELATAATRHGVTFVRGTEFLLDGGHDHVRLAYSGLTPDLIDDGVGRLAAAFRSVIVTKAG